MSAIKQLPINLTAQVVAHQVAKQPRQQARRALNERGQSTVEYALLVVGIATLALLVLAWASSTDVVGALFDRVFRWVTGRVG